MRKEQRKDRTIKRKSQKITDVDSAGHQIGRNSTLAQQKRQNAETAKEEALTKRYADQRNEYNTLIEQYHRRKSTTGNTIESRE